MTKISVIVPVYKTENYILDCLKSVSEQTFSDIEIICVDDCSPDGSAELIRQYMKEDDRVKLIQHEKNLGLGGARNSAIRIANGDFLASVDSDDKMRPEMLSTLYDASDGQTADIVVCGFNRVDENGGILSKQTPYSGTVYNIDDDLDIFRVMNPAFWNKLWRKSLYTDNNIYFPNYVFYQDTATTPRIITKAKKIVSIGDHLYDYLMRPDSATFTYSPKHVLDYYTVFDTIKHYLVAEGLYERYKFQFETMISNSLRFHTQNVLDKKIDTDTKHRYLKQLLMLKRSYLTHDDELANMDLNGLTAELSEAADRSRSEKSVSIGGITKPEEQNASQIIDEVEQTIRESVLNQSGYQHTFRRRPKTLRDVSVLVKTFQRPDMVKRFLDAVGQYQIEQNVKFAEVIVGDDSTDDVLQKNRTTIKSAMSAYEGLNVRHDIYEFNIGLSDARNRMMEAAQTKYVILCDDDFVFDPECDVRLPLKIIVEKKIDILGGWLKNNYNFETDTYTYWGAHGKMIDQEDELIVFLNETSVGEFEPSDFLLNFFLANRESVLNVRWDPDLKIEEHYDFFYRFYHSKYKAALTNTLFVKHTNERPNNSAEYNKYRFSKENWEPALFKSIEKLGKKRRTITRWRKDHAERWRSDLTSRKDKRTRIELEQAILCQHVNVERLTPAFDNFFFGYFDVPAQTSDGRYHLCQSAPVIDQLPTPESVSEIFVIDRQNDNQLRKIGETNAWCHQQGSQLQFRKQHPTEAIYNIFDTESASFKARSVDIQTGKIKDHPRPIAAISPDGTWALSLNFARLYDYRPGYGYSNIADIYTHQPGPQKDGLFRMNLDTGEVEQILSYHDLHERFVVGRFPLREKDRVLINHVGYNTDGSKIVILFRIFSDMAPFPTFTLVCNADGSGLEEVFPFTSHYHWRDEEVLLLSGAPVFNRKKLKTVDLYELNTNTGERTIIDRDFFKGDGHCTYSPDRSLILYDSYSSTAFPYRKLQIYDIEQGKGIDVGYFYSPPSLHGNMTDARCDLHPRWSPDGSEITFDSLHEGYRGIYRIDINEVRAALARGFHSPNENDLKLWYSAQANAKKPKPKPKPKSKQIVTAAPKETTSLKLARRFTHPAKRMYGTFVRTPVVGPMLRTVVRPTYYFFANPVYVFLTREKK